MTRKAFMMIFLLALTGTITIQAQSVDEVLSKYFDNTGGIRKWRKLKTLVMRGTYPSPQGNIDFVIYKKSPNLLKQVIDVNGHEIVPQAYDGTTAWTINPLLGEDGRQPLPEKVASKVADNAVFQDELLDYDKKGAVATYEGVQELDGQPMYVIELRKSGEDSEQTEIYYFDQETYLPLVVKTVESNGEEILTYFSQYQKTDGKLIMPFQIESKVNGETINKIVFHQISTNKKIKDEEFAYQVN